MKREEFSLARGICGLWGGGGPGLRRCKRLEPAAILREEAAPANAAPEQDSGQLEEPLLVLVNGENAVPESWWFLPYLVDDEVVDRRMAEDLSALLEAAESQGVWLWVAWLPQPPAAGGHFWKAPSRSAWPRGSREQARAKALETIAQPGHSEHETGLALDFNDVSQGFQETVAYQWLRQLGRRTGLSSGIKGKRRPSPGVKAEPWHFRYVGREHALAMERLGAVPGGVRPLAKGLGRPLKNAALSCQTAPGCAL